MTELHMHPAQLEAFAKSVGAQVADLKTQMLKPVSVEPGVFGSFDAADALTTALNAQLKEVHNRLSTSIVILEKLGQAATIAADMMGQSDTAVQNQMQSVNTLLGQAETGLNGAILEEQKSSGTPAPTGTGRVVPI